MCDLSDLNAVNKLVDELRQHTKKIDLFIYNAGILIPSYSWEATTDQLTAVMNVNFFAPIRLINGLLSKIEGGHIALVASVVSIIDGGNFLTI